MVECPQSFPPHDFKMVELRWWIMWGLSPCFWGVDVILQRGLAGGHWLCGANCILYCCWAGLHVWWVCVSLGVILVMWGSSPYCLRCYGSKPWLSYCWLYCVCAVVSTLRLSIVLCIAQVYMGGGEMEVTGRALVGWTGTDGCFHLQHWGMLTYARWLC